MSQALAPTKSFASVDAGWELPALSVPITATLITATAMATRDYENVHHDLEATRKLGSPHIFMNILTTNGFCQRFIEEAFGPECIFKDLKIKLGAPNFVGDTMKLTGSVSAKDEINKTVEVAFKGSNSMGSHVTGTAKVQLP